MGFRNMTSWVGLNDISLMGGVPVFIKVSGGVDMNAQKNTIAVISKNIPQAQFIQPAISDNDAFNSNPAAGLIGWTIPSAMDIFSTPNDPATYFDFNNLPGGLPGAYPSTSGGVDYLTFDISIASMEYSPPCYTYWTNCHFTYNQRYTPQLYDTVPNQVYAGAKINFWLNPGLIFDKLPSSYNPFYYLKLGNFHTNWDGLINTKFRLPSNRWSLVPTVVEDQPSAKSVDPDINFSMHGRTFIRNTAKHCNFDGDDCWTVRVHPRIDSLSQSTGYVNGGQILKIKGVGLQGPDITVKVDGVDCIVDHSMSDDKVITCETQSKGTPSLVNFKQPGNHGVTHTFINPTDSGQAIGWPGFTDGLHPQTQGLATTLESTSIFWDQKAGQRFDGWFRAPETGEYKFYLSADDQVKLFMDISNPFDPSSQYAGNLYSTQNSIAYSWFSLGFRHYERTPRNSYFEPWGQFQSQWITLEGGKFYKFQAQHIDWGGNYWMSIGVEFKKAAGGHPLATKAIHNLRIEQNPTRAEKWTLTVVNPSSGQYVLALQSPKEATLWKSAAISCNEPSNTFGGKIAAFFQGSTRLGGNMQVDLVMYDINGIITPNTGMAKKYIYTITVMKRTTGGASFTSYQVIPVGTITSVVTVMPPYGASGITSSKPLAGSFVISCPNPNLPGVNFVTRPQAYNRDANDIQADFDEDISWLRGKVTIHASIDGVLSDEFKFNYRENGVNLFLIFDGLDSNPPQCVIQSDSTNPITGDSPQFISEEYRTYGTGIKFEPVGMEFLYTDALNPQVMVEINGIPAVCPNLNCDYSYVAATQSIATQAYNTATKQIVLTGSNLPTSDYTLSFGGAACAISPAPTLSPTSLTCTLAHEPSAGYHKAEIRVAGGLIPFANGVSDIYIPLVTSSVSPTSINPLGGAILTITGSGFPLKTNLVEVTFSDSTECTVLTVSETQITCKVKGFSNLDGSQRTINVNVNNIRYLTRRRELFSVVPETTNNLTLDCTANIPQLLSIDKTNVSPVLKTEIEFQLDNNYADTLNAGDLTVKVLNVAKGYSRILYVMSANDADKTFKVKFNGAPVGTYTFSIYANSASQYGLLDTTGITLTTSSAITSIRPTSGSVFGGTVLTITVSNISTVKTDQAVKVGDFYCDILTATSSSLTCRIRETKLAADQTSTDNQVIVVLAAASEATCDDGNGCKFEFKTPTATVQIVSTAINMVSKAIEISVTGSGFPTGNTNEVELYIDNRLQTTLSVDSETSLKVKVIDVDHQNTQDLKIYFSDGLPSGYKDLLPLTLTPTFAGVSPVNEGSQGGTYLTVIAPGIGINTKGLNLFSVTDNMNLCIKTWVEQYGQFTCLTDAVEILSTDTIKLALDTVNAAGVVTTEYKECADLPNCQITQTLASSPQVSSASLSGDEITFTGSNFPVEAAGWTAKAYFKSSSVDISGWTSTSATAQFVNGVPASEAGDTDVPNLRFKRTSDGFVFYAYADYSFTANTVSATDSTSGMAVSFAGGRLYTVTGANLLASLKEPGNSISVCGNECKVDEDLSDNTQVQCMLPPLATTYSIQNYQIINPGPISGTWSASVPDQIQFIKDGVWPTQFLDPNSNCFIELSFPGGQVGVLDSAKILLNEVPANKLPFLNTLKLKGWDGTAYQTIWTADANIHDGWNTITFDAANKPAYSKYRWTGTTAGSCRIGEIVFNGVVAINEETQITICSPKLKIGSTTTSLNDVAYNAELTPAITSITPRFGKVSGNELIIIQGVNFIDNTNGVTTVTIDGISCAVIGEYTTTTQIKCLTGARPGDNPNPSIVIKVPGFGLAATNGNTFFYVQYWSEPSTWGYDYPPQYGEAVQIPKGRTLLVDVDVVPQLSFVLVEGSIIFAPHTDPNHERTFDAGYIFIKDGYMEVGTEAHPYTSKLTITMHGDVSSPALPTYGNKNIAVRGGTLSMVGKERKVVWTLLEKTAEINDNQITLQSQADNTFDWAVGEQIVIASTSYDKNQAEVRIITAVSYDALDASKPLLTLDKPLVYKHYADTETYGTDVIDMRAEVGLLTRNVKFRGDPETSARNKYGAHIMLHSPGDESSIGRIMYIELTDVGQAFKLGRYPIHFHLIGTVAKSLVQGNSIHQTYNRAVTIHAVSYFHVINNVIYNTMGHSIFIEDAIETKNVIDGNLVIGTNRSWSLLNSDQTPASFWITNPDNVIINNRAAGSDRYGFWYDLQVHPLGPSYTQTICPENTRLGEFRNNVAHSNGRYGLRIFHRLIPRQNPCAALVFDKDTTKPGFPYPLNPVIPAVFKDFTSWKNLVNGAIAEQTGAVIWQNFKVADNMMAGLEWSVPDQSVAVVDMSYIDGAAIIGISGNKEPALENAPFVYGLITPRGNEWWSAKNIHFYSMAFNRGTAAIGDCSHCFFADSTDSGARTITLSGLTFDDSITRRIKYQMPWRGIFLDLDGSLTGKGPNTWASAHFSHNEQKECETNLAVYDGQICDNTVQVRRIVFFDPKPSTIMGLNLRVAKYDDSEMAKLTPEQKKAYQKNDANYDKAYMTVLQKPDYAWALPYVTGHKYRFYFDMGQLDILNIKMEMSVRWLPTDKYVEFNLPYIDKRENIDFFTAYNYDFTKANYLNYLIPPSTLDPANRVNWLSGFNYNDNLIRSELDFVITGNALSSKTLQINGIRCRDNVMPWCNLNPQVVQCTGTAKLWSDPASWVTQFNPAGGVPVEGQDVYIPAGEIYIFDLEESPILGLVQVDGCLQFLSSNDKDQHLRAHLIYVHTGKFQIGSPLLAYLKKATITLYGDYDSSTVTFGNLSEAGNKLIANNGEVRFHGKVRSAMSRLLDVAKKGDSTVYVESSLDWVAGDELGFAASGMEWNHSEHAIIQSYDSVTGELVLTAPLEYYHFGAPTSTGPNYQGLDMRGEVILLNRNILIRGDKTQNDWQAQFVTSDAIQIDAQGNEITLQGLTILENVEFYNMGQINTEKAALRFDHSNRADGAAIEHSKVEGCVIHDSGTFAIYVTYSRNIDVINTNVFTAMQLGVILDIVTNVHFDGVNVFDVRKRGGMSNDDLADKECCVAFGSWSEYQPTYTSSYKNSIVAGCPFAGLIAHGHSCNDPVGTSSSATVKNIVAHSIYGSGVLMLPDVAIYEDSKLCYQMSYIKAYKNAQHGIATDYKTDEVRASNVVLVDNQLGITLMVVGEGTQKVMKLSDSYIYGETPDLHNDCPNDDTGATCYCPDKHGFMNFYAMNKGKGAHITEKAARPVYNTKSFALWDAKALITNVVFSNFKTRTACNARQSVMGLPDIYSPDIIPIHYFTGVRFVNVEQDALAYLRDPPLVWASINDCGAWPCTGSSNLVWNFYDTVWQTNDGVTSLPSFWTGGVIKYNFQLVGKVTSAGDTYPDCAFNNEMNAYFCAPSNQASPLNIGVLEFESLDGDKETRNVHPVVITNADGYSNTLNSFMDHDWDGFYTSKKRLSRFPAQVLTGKRYTVTFTGTPPKHMRYILRADSGNDGIVVKVPYPNASSYSVKVNDVIVPQLGWDNDTQQRLTIDPATAVCGTNRYVGVENFLEFYLTPGCLVNIIPRDAIMAFVRLSWTSSEFFDGDGVTTFVQRMAAVLNIDPSRIKVVQVFEGSLNIQIVIESAMSFFETTVEEVVIPSEPGYVELNNLMKLLVNTFKAGNTSLGAPMLETTSSIQTAVVLNQSGGDGGGGDGGDGDGGGDDGSSSGGGSSSSTQPYDEWSNWIPWIPGSAVTNFVSFATCLALTALAVF